MSYNVAEEEKVAIWPPKSSDDLFALNTITKAFHLMRDLILRSMKRSPGILASSFTGIEFLNGVVRLKSGMVPDSVNFDASFPKMNEALSLPSSLIIFSKASNHSLSSRSFTGLFILD